MLLKNYAQNNILEAFCENWLWYEINHIAPFDIFNSQLRMLLLSVNTQAMILRHAKGHIQSIEYCYNNSALIVNQKI